MIEYLAVFGHVTAQGTTALGSLGNFLLLLLGFDTVCLTLSLQCFGLSDLGIQFLVNDLTLCDVSLGVGGMAGDGHVIKSGDSLHVTYPYLLAVMVLFLHVR